MTLGQRLKAARLRWGLSQADLGKRIGVKNSTILIAERDKCPGVAARALAVCDHALTADEQKICAALDCNSPPGAPFGKRRPRYCDEHRTAISETVNKFRAKRKAAGLCLRCDKPSAAAAGLCGAHWAERLAQTAELKRRDRKCPACGKRGHLRVDHRAMGLCSRCGSPATTTVRNGTLVCDHHDKIIRAEAVDNQRRQWARRIEAGVCHRCKGRPLAERSASRCEVCLKLAAEDQARRAARQNERKVAAE
jgi:DNA-binding XRE family transcriptional regulator